MYASIIESVLQKYGVEWKSIGQVQKGYRNESYKITRSDGNHINLFFYKSEPSILTKIINADSSSGLLHNAQMPVRVRIDHRILRVKENTYASLYNYLPGKTISWEAYTIRHIKLLGWAMGDIHDMWNGQDGRDYDRITDILNNQLAKMIEYFSDVNVITAASKKLNVSIYCSKLFSFSGIFIHCKKLAGQHLLHMDMVRGNVLFDSTGTYEGYWRIDNTVLTGIIDFEKAAFGHPVFDIARTLAFLLVDCPKQPEKTIYYFLESGYNKRSKSRLMNTEPLQALITYFLMYDLYKFMRHAPYESLSQNYHYMRTRDILAKYGMISIDNK